MPVEAVRIKGGVQIQFNDGRIGFVQSREVEKLAYKLLGILDSNTNIKTTKIKRSLDVSAGPNWERRNDQPEIL